MARIVITPLANKDLSELVENIGQNKFIEDLSMITTYAFRAKIIMDRNYRGFEKAEVKGPVDGFENSGRSIMAVADREKFEARIRDGREGRIQDNSTSREDYTSETYLGVRDKQILSDSISIVDYDYRDSKHKNKRGYSTITLPWIPRELSYQPESKFIGIATMGRNNPHYHFTGSEDSITFEIDWFFTDDESRERVINSCRWVEALTKADAYQEPPHRVKLVWGQDNKLFEDDIWLITSAPYTLSQFSKGHRVEGEIVRTGLLPQQAIQTVTLKRLTNNNLTTSEIMGKLSKRI